MNKYQVALNKIINHKCYEKESSCWDYVKTIYKEETNTLQELVDNETPMKVDKNKKGSFPNYDKDNTYHTTYKCPKCNCTIHLDWNEIRKFCPECGVELDWSDIDE